MAMAPLYSDCPMTGLGGTVTDNLIGGYMFAVTPDQLARLPDGVCVALEDGQARHRLHTRGPMKWLVSEDLSHEVPVSAWRGPMWLNLVDPSTQRGLLNALMWLDVAGVAVPRTESELHAANQVIRREPLADEQLADFARLARAALENTCQT